MATDRITLEISAKDLASSVLNRVKAGTVALGVVMGNFATKAISGAINGLRGWVNEALDAEKANVMLDASLRGAGQYTDALAKQYRDLANAIQDETGASDEAGKANIALLVSMGVLPDKMATAARGVQALASLNVEGSMAAKAMARALEGDMTAFDRLSPAVRLATTDAEKTEAVITFLAAGFEQQKASLNTVGGAWAALKGRLGDAREDLIGAVFDGLKLGTTFDTMQEKVGAFLKSDSFKNITDRLREGAAFALDMANALTTKGGFTETAASMGDILLGALKDGADYIGAKIEKALGRKIDSLDPRLAKASRFWGAMSAGDGVSKSLDAMDRERTVEAGGGNMAAAVKRYEDAKAKRGGGAPVRGSWGDMQRLENERIAQEKKDQEATADKDKRANDIRTAALERAARLAQEANVEMMTRANHAEAITALESDIEDAKRAQARNAENAADLEARSNDIGRGGLTKWLSDAEAGREGEKARMKDEMKSQKNIDRLQAAYDRNGKLSKSDQRKLDDAKAMGNEAQRLLDAANQAKVDAADAAKAVKQLEDKKMALQEKMETHLAAISTDLKDALKNKD